MSREVGAPPGLPAAVALAPQALDAVYSLDSAPAALRLASRPYLAHPALSDVAAACQLARDWRAQPKRAKCGDAASSPGRWQQARPLARGLLPQRKRQEPWLGKPDEQSLKGLVAEERRRRRQNCPGSPLQPAEADNHITSLVQRHL